MQTKLLAGFDDNTSLDQLSTNQRIARIVTMIYDVYKLKREGYVQLLDFLKESLDTELSDIEIAVAIAGGCDLKMCSTVLYHLMLPMPHDQAAKVNAIRVQRILKEIIPNIKMVDGQATLSFTDYTIMVNGLFINEKVSVFQALPSAVQEYYKLQ